jgi:antitoxin component of MazEF toxin-antitoxin module
MEKKMIYKTRLIPIGNSMGVRIPQHLVWQLELAGEVELVLEDNRLIVRAAHTARQGWAAAFSQMGQFGDNELMDAEVSTAFDDQEWEW